MAKEEEIDSFVTDLGQSLARSLDPGAFEPVHDVDLYGRHRQVVARTRVAMKAFGRAMTDEYENRSFEQWVKEAPMAMEVRHTPQAVDPLLILTLELAGMLDPKACGDLRVDDFDPKALWHHQAHTVERAAEFVKRLCAQVEREYADYMFRSKTSRA